MPYKIKVRQNDTKPFISAVLVSNPDGIPHNLTGTTVVFSMAATIGSTSQKIKEKAVIIMNALLGQVRYVWGIGDTDTVGTYYGEFEVTFADGSILTFPERDEDGTGGYIEIEIFTEIA